MNNYITPGNYYGASDSTVLTYKNCPFIHSFTLKIEQPIPGYISQTFTEYNTGRKAYRLYNSQAKSWVSQFVYFSDDAALFTGTNIQSGDDINNYTTPGIYRSSSSNITATLLNMPEMFGSGFSLLVLPISTVMNIQIILPSANGSRFYYRGSTTSGWNESWYQYTGTQIS